MSWAFGSTTSSSTHPDARGPLASYLGIFAVAMGLMVCLPATASADLVTFRGGRVLNVAAVRFDGTEVVLSLRSGGEMRAPADFVVEVRPDEVPWPEPETAAPAESTEAPAAAESTGPPLGTTDIARLINQLAAHHGVDARLAHAIVQVESNYQARAVSPKGAMGLMQLMPATAQQYAVQDPFDPVQNLNAGLQHLRGLLDRFGTGRESLALAAYNAGEGTVKRYKGIPPYPETRNYVQRILSLTGR